MVSISLLLSLPLVNGTIQKLHILSQPRIIELFVSGWGGIGTHVQFQEQLTYSDFYITIIHTKQ